MSVWIKICGNTSLADARLAVEAGADAVGFVLAPSPRQVTVAETAGICSHLPENIEKIGVFVDAGLEEIYAAVRTCGLTAVQLHFDAAEHFPARLHARLGSHVRILRVVHFDAAAGELTSQKVAKLAKDAHVHGALVDSRTAGAVGGTGVTFDWAEARRTVFRDSSGLRLIAAGGLHPGNVTEAIATLDPWGVDVASGVEAAPGRKDAWKVREFVARARAVQTG